MVQQGRPKKTSKKMHTTRIATTECPNLRPRPQRNNAQREEEQLLADMHPVGDFLDNNEGTIISTNPSTVLEGQSLGRQFCEVIVTHVLKKDAILPRPYPNMDTMAESEMMSIAWPYKKLKICKKASIPPASGSVGC